VAAQLGLNTMSQRADQGGVTRPHMSSSTVDLRRLAPLLAVFVVAEHLVIAQAVPADSWLQHPRSSAWAMGVAGLVLLVLCFRRVSAGCWLLAAGAGANLLSWTDDGAVPNYVTVAVADRWLAFNLPDAAIVVGALMMLVPLVGGAVFEVRRGNGGSWRDSR
jgi:hypothetical protein